MCNLHFYLYLTSYSRISEASGIVVFTREIYEEYKI